MSVEYVTLVAQGGTPVRLADQTGAPYPTTGSGALVFNHRPVIYDATLINPVIDTTGDREVVLVPIFSAIQDIVYATLPPTSILTAGYWVGGDEGGAIYIRVGLSEPSVPASAKFQLGVYWYKLNMRYVNPTMFGGFGFAFDRNTWSPIGRPQSTTPIVDCVQYATGENAIMEWGSLIYISETAITLRQGYVNRFGSFNIDLSRATGIVVASGKTLLYLRGNDPTTIGSLTSTVFQGGYIAQLSAADAANLTIGDQILLLSDQSLTSQASNKALNCQQTEVHTIDQDMIDPTKYNIAFRDFFKNDFLVADNARILKLDTSTRIEISGEGCIYGSGGSPAGINPPPVFQRGYFGVYTFGSTYNKWTTINCERGCWGESNCCRTHGQVVNFNGCSNWRIAAYGVSSSGCQDAYYGHVYTNGGARHAVTSNAGNSQFGSWASDGLSYGDIEHLNGYAGAMDTHPGVGMVKAGHVRVSYSPDFSTGSSQAVFSQGAGYQVQSLHVVNGGSTAAAFQSLGWRIKNFNPSAYIGSVRGDGTVSSAVSCDNLTSHGDVIDSATGVIVSGTYNTTTGVIVLTLDRTADSLFAACPANLSSLTGTGAFASLNGVNYVVSSVVGTVVTIAGTPGAGAATITGGTLSAVTGTYNSGTGVTVLRMTTAPTYVVGATVTLSSLTGTGSYTSIDGTWPVTAINGVLVTLAVTPALGAGNITGGDLHWATSALSIISGTYDTGTGATVLTLDAITSYPVGTLINISGLTGTGAFASINGTWAVTARTNTTVTLAVTSGFGAATITGGVLHAPYLSQTCTLHVNDIQGWFDQGINAVPTEGDVFIEVGGGNFTCTNDSAIRAVATATGRCEVRASKCKITSLPNTPSPVGANGSAWAGTGYGAKVWLTQSSIVSLSRDIVVSSTASQVLFADVDVTVSGVASYPAAPLFYSSSIATTSNYTTGVWTPALTCATPGNLAFTGVTASGTWSKNGNDVTIAFLFTGSPTFTTASGNMQITGLPFVAGVTPREAIPLRQISSGFTWPGAPSVAMACTESGQSYLSVVAMKSATGVANFQIGAIVSGGGAVTIEGSGTYSVV